jgi:hypothetical protein
MWVGRRACVRIGATTSSKLTRWYSCFARYPPALLSTAAQVWVVDCADTRRLGDCKAEFEKLLQQERLAGSSLLVFANKQVRRQHVLPRVALADAQQDLPGALSSEEVRAALGLDAIQDRHWKIQVLRGGTWHELFIISPPQLPRKL